MVNYIKSPIHYMGCKYDLLPYLIEQFPKPEEVTTFYDLFGGSGTVSLNVPYKNVVYNELNDNMVNLLKMIRDTEPQEIIDHINKRIKEFGLNEEGTDIRQNVEGIEELRNYYNNKYLEFRKFYNESEKDIKDLYALSFYSFCNLMRFNSKNEFNMPFGNRCFIKEDSYRLIEAHNRFLEKNIDLRQGDTFELLKNITKNEGQFLYSDSPYTSSTAIYNENRAFGGWGIEEDERLFNELDRLTKLGIKWAYSNVLSIKGKDNDHIEAWATRNGYTIIELENKEYSSLGKGNANAREVLIINYEQRTKRYSIFDFLDE